MGIQIRLAERAVVHEHTPLVTTGSPLRLTFTQRVVVVCVAETENLACVAPAIRPEFRYVTTPGSLIEILLAAACVSTVAPPTATVQPPAHVPIGESVTLVFCLMASLRARSREVNRSIAAICTRWLAISSLNEGTAIMVRTTRTATTASSSTRVKPRACFDP